MTSHLLYPHGWHQSFNWLIDHLPELNRGSGLGVYFLLCSRRDPATGDADGPSQSEMAEMLDVDPTTIFRAVKLLEGIGAISVTRPRGKPVYTIHPVAPGEVIAMPVLGSDPEEEPSRRTKKERRVALGGTDQVDPAPLPKRRYRDTPASLVTYFEDTVLHPKMLGSKHSNRGALRKRFSEMLADDLDPDHIRRMIRRFAQDMVLKPDQPAWLAFLGRRHQLESQTAARDEAEIDYEAEGQIDPRLLGESG